MSGGGSIPFDRAAEEYDRTRRLTRAASAAVTELLAAELAGREPCLEIGVGTGLIALPLHDAGVRMVGVDLSMPMIGKLLQKTNDRSPFPISLADATRLPFRDRVFGGALARHVLHLISDWRRAVEELVRVVRPGGVLLLNIGVHHDGPWQELSDRLEAQVGGQAQRVGIEPQDAPLLEAAVGALGARMRELPTVWQESDLTLDRYFRETEERAYSWTWSVPDGTLAAAIETTRAWALDRFGRFDEVLEPRFPIVWRAYDLG